MADRAAGGATVYTAEQPGGGRAVLGPAGGPPGQRRNRARPASTLGNGNGRYVLLWLTQLARSDACSANPYRGAISGLAVEPAG